MTKIKKRVKNYNRYPNDLKRKIAKEYLSGQASYSILAEENGLRNKGVVKEFVKWYKRQLSKETSKIPTTEKMTSEDTDESPEEATADITALRTTILALREQLSNSELRVEMLETMIDVAESELSIDIRKKSGTNQSKK